MVPVGLLFLAMTKRIGRVVAVRVRKVPKTIGQRWWSLRAERGNLSVWIASVAKPLRNDGEDDPGFGVVDSMITLSFYYKYRGIGKKDPSTTLGMTIYIIV